MPDGSTLVELSAETNGRDPEVEPVQNWRDPERWTPTLDRIPLRLDRFVPQNPDLVIDAIDWSVAIRDPVGNTRTADVAVGFKRREVIDHLRTESINSGTNRHTLDTRLILARSFAIDTTADVVNFDGTSQYTEPIRWRSEEYLHFGVRNDNDHNGVSARFNLQWRRG